MIVMLNGYDVIHEAFTRQADVFTDRPQLFAPLIGVSKGTGRKKTGDKSAMHENIHQYGLHVSFTAHSVYLSRRSIAFF